MRPARLPSRRTLPRVPNSCSWVLRSASVRTAGAGLRAGAGLTQTSPAPRGPAARATGHVHPPKAPSLWARGGQHMSRGRARSRGAHSVPEAHRPPVPPPGRLLGVPWLLGSEAVCKQTATQGRGTAFFSTCISPGASVRRQGWGWVSS